MGTSQDKPKPGSEFSQRDDSSLLVFEENRWQRVFQRSREPIFFLDQQSRFLFVNKSWEELTGLTWKEVRQVKCEGTLSPEPGTTQALFHILNPPQDILDDSPRQLRRLTTFPSPQLWEISFFPILGEKKRIGILGKISPLPVGPTESPAPVPNKLLALRDRIGHFFRLDRFIAESSAMKRVARQIRLAVQTSSPLWIVGEPGTGKQAIARTIHQEGRHRHRPFVPVDCRLWPDDLVAEILLGKSRYWGDSLPGMIYLKNPQHLSREFQVQLVDWLNQVPNREENAQAFPQIVAGCCSDPIQEVQTGRLTESFHHLFGVLNIAVPPLRERREDFDLLIDHFLGRAGEVSEQKIEGLSKEGREILKAAPWPENLRELQLVLRQACLRAPGPVIQGTDLPFYLRADPQPKLRSLPLDTLLEQVERRLMQLALQWSKQNKSKAAEILSIWRGRLIKRCKDLGIEGEE